MPSRGSRRLLLVVGVLLGCVGLVLIGRRTADDGGATPGTTSGSSDGSAASPAYEAGLAEGLREGRSLQEASTVPSALGAAVRAAFDDGYAAGAGDVFAGYDGGWVLGTAYVVTLAHGSGAIPYRISSRTPMRSGAAYALCGPARVCETAHP